MEIIKNVYEAIFLNIQKNKYLHNCLCGLFFFNPNK